MVFLIAIIFVITLTIYFLKSHYEYWEKRAVPGPKPIWIVGNMAQSLTMKKSMLEIYADIYHEYKKYPLVGIFKATTPTLLICDPELIKDMTVKSFHHFHDNDLEVDKDVDPIFGRNPFCLKGEEWKIVRSQLTPGFTSGKMKLVYPLLEDTSLEMVKFIDDEPTTLNGQGYESKQLCSKFTLNNVANCAFGLQAKAFTHESSEFQEIAKQFFAMGTLETIVFMIMFLFPQIMKLKKMRFIKKEVEDQLTNIVTQTLLYREKNSIVRNDFLHILKQLKKTCKDYEFTDVDVTAHASGFFIDGYETSAGVMSFILFEVAANSEIQERLREEVGEHFDDNDQTLAYDVLQGLPYLDAVVNETLRMHPPLFSLGKICTKEYTYLPKKDDGIGKPVVIEKGTSVVIPLFGLQRDPQYFENPNVFNPDRFLGANKENIVKYTFMPFGEGPRACLGQRFGLLQIKVGVAHIIKNFKLSVNTKTILPLQYDPVSFLTAPKGGLWLDFEKIK